MHTKYLEIVSDFKFLPDYNSLVSRDYFNLNLWDLRMFNKPVKIMPVFPQMNKHLNTLIVSSRLDDRFKLDTRGSKVLTSFYGDSFHVIDMQDDSNVRVSV